MFCFFLFDSEYFLCLFDCFFNFFLLRFSIFHQGISGFFDILEQVSFRFVLCYEFEEELVTDVVEGAHHMIFLRSIGMCRLNVCWLGVLATILLAILADVLTTVLASVTSTILIGATVLAAGDVTRVILVMGISGCFIAEIACTSVPLFEVCGIRCCNHHGSIRGFR